MVVNTMIKKGSNLMRNVIIVNATQVVASENHPEGLFSTMSGFPKTFDSINYNGDVEATMKAAKVAYYDQLSKNYSYTNRAMTTVTLEVANGRQIMYESIGSFPDPISTPEPEEEPETEPEEP